MNLVGKLLGNRYEILEKIGSGGMATVYKARCLVLKRYVAVKVLREEYTTDNEFIKRFNTEAESAASLTHPNIVSVYDVGQEGNLYYIVMELIKGKTLKEIIVEQGKLGWKWSVKIGLQIASALETAHRNNIVHRDIKPHNIIITEDGTAKVTDFGIAKAVSNSTITAFGTTLGSVHYFSPEHARGGYTDAKSDLYSLGVVMYEMITGRVPFDADTPVSVALKHMQEKPIEPIKLNPAIPQSVNDIIMKAMQKDPNMRYETATEMIADLEYALRNPNASIDSDDEKDFDTQKVRVQGKSKHSRVEEDDDDDDEEDEEDYEEMGFFGKIGYFFSEHPVVKWILIVILLIAVFVGTIAITIGIKKANEPKKLDMPNLVGLTLEEAKEKYGDIIEIEVEDEAFDPEAPEGQIVKQSPVFQENYQITEGAKIKVTISKGQNIVQVPKFVGLTKDEAMKLANEKELVLDIQEDFDDEIEKGIVILQKLPEAAEGTELAEGTEILAGTKIQIKVSLGIEQVVVPNLVGMTEAEAKAKITEAKLTLKSATKKTDMKAKYGEVIEQSVAADSKVDKNTEISIYINDYQAIKSATAIINVAKLTGYTPHYKKVDTGEVDEAGNPIYREELETPDKVRVIVTVNDKQWASELVSKATEDFQVGFDETDTVRIVVTIDGSQAAVRDLDLNSSTTITITR